jgi:hypothetical protein
VCLLASSGASAHSEPTRARQPEKGQPWHAPVGLGSGMKRHSIAQENTMRVLRPVLLTVVLTLVPGVGILTILLLAARGWSRGL